MRSASSNAFSAFAGSPLFDAESPSMKCPHAFSGFCTVYSSNICVASPNFPTLYAVSPSANDTGPVIFGVTLSPLSPATDDSLVIETGVAFAEYSDEAFGCDVSSLLEQPTAASVATSSVAVICPLGFISSPLLSAAFVAAEPSEGINARRSPHRHD